MALNISKQYEAAADLERNVESAYAARIAGGKLKQEEVEYVSRLPLRYINDQRRLKGEMLNLIRTLCRTYDTDLFVGEISSHRKIIGPIIVKVKKLIFPVLRFFLKEYVRRQKEFNAATIAAILELAGREGRER